MTLNEIIADLQDQLDWRGPSGSPQGNIVLPRSEAEELQRYLVHLGSMLAALRMLADPLTNFSDLDDAKGIERALKLIVAMQTVAKNTLKAVCCDCEPSSPPPPSPPTAPSVEPAP